MLSLVLGLLLIRPPIDGYFEPPEGASAAELLEQAVELYQQERFEDAARAFRKAFALEPSPKYLYAWAQAEREAGNCAAALDLYQQFIEQGASEAAAATAEENIERCEVQLREEERLAQEEKARQEALAASARPARPWYRDPLGGTLVGIGAAGMIGGGVLLGLAGAEARSQPETVVEFRASLQRERNLAIAGGVAAGVGALVLVGGITRWMVLKGREDNEPRVTVAPTFGGLHLEVDF